mgnify:CR=1 FL=1
MRLEAKLAGLAAMGLASWLAPKIAGQTWKFVTGNEPPSDEEGSTFAQILIFAALSAVVVTAIQTGADRATAKVLGPKDDAKA